VCSGSALDADEEIGALSTAKSCRSGSAFDADGENWSTVDC
jgi:hypothetical protein